MDDSVDLGRQVVEARSLLRHLIFKVRNKRGHVFEDHFDNPHIQIQRESFLSS